MKKILLLILIPVFLFSCSNNDVDPDLTSNFVGTWGTDWVQDTPNIQTKSTWNITKVDDSTLKITAFTELKSGNPEFVDSGTDIVDGLKIIDRNTFTIDVAPTKENDFTKSEGNGIVSGNTLTVVVKSTEIKTGEVYSSSLTLIKK